MSRTVSNGVTTGYRYNRNGSLTIVETKDSRGNVLDRYSYAYDRAGNRATMTTMTGSVAYTYDRKDQLISAKWGDGGEEVFKYDGNGNRVEGFVKRPEGKSFLAEKILYEYDAADQLIKMMKKAGNGNHGAFATKVEYAYDKNGNLVRETGGGEEVLYDYDYLGRLVSVKRGGKEAAGYGYDLLDRRVRKTEDGRSIGYIYDGMNILMEEDDGGKILAKYLNGAGIDEPLLKEIVESKEKQYYLQDGLGSISAVVDGKGRIKDRHQYASFGGARNGIGRIGFTGREYDKAAGLYYYRARY